MTSFASVVGLLNEAMGLDVASIGASAVERALRERQQACDLQDPRAYWQRLRSSDTELQALIEAVVVPETWFFRDHEAFEGLIRIVRDEWMPVHPTGVLRILSVPCSTGEEPYSIAMALIDAGLPAARFRVDAMDISERALAHARRGVYGARAFRATDLGFRDRHFEQAPRGHRIRNGPRQHVTFLQGNLLTSPFLNRTAHYDIAFCRNVLIYFDTEAQSRAVRVLTGLLAARGVLFVGSSEAGVLLNHGFVSARLPMAFAFRRAESPPSGPARRPPSPGPIVSSTAPAAPPPPVAAAPASAAGSPILETVDAEPRLAEAARLGDQGRFAEAAAICEADMRCHGPSAAGFHLLGLVREASGNLAEAAQCYKKALYLDPAHQEVLGHFALLMDRLGRAEEAHVLRNRASRLARQDHS